MSNAPLRRDLPKVGIVGAGQVGSALAYACLIRDTAPIISLYDIDKLRVDAQVADLAHGSIFAEPEVIGGADVSSMRDCDVIVITSGAPQKPGQSRLDLAGINAKIIADVMPKMLEVSPDALYVIVANPCDVLAVVAQKVSGLPTNRVFATGTGLDTARLRHLIARRAHVRERNVEAALFHEQLRTGRMAGDEQHGMRLRKLLQRRVPLAHLVDIHVAVGEVHAHAIAVLGQRPALSNELAHPEQGAAPGEHLLGKFLGTLHVSCYLHASSLFECARARIMRCC